MNKIPGGFMRKSGGIDSTTQTALSIVIFFLLPYRKAQKNAQPQIVFLTLAATQLKTAVPRLSQDRQKEKKAQDARLKKLTRKIRNLLNTLQSQSDTLNSKSPEIYSEPQPLSDYCSYLKSYCSDYKEQLASWEKSVSSCHAELEELSRTTSANEFFDAKSLRDSIEEEKELAWKLHHRRFDHYQQLRPNENQLFFFETLINAVNELSKFVEEKKAILRDCDYEAFKAKAAQGQLSDSYDILRENVFHEKLSRELHAAKERLIASSRYIVQITEGSHKEKLRSIMAQLEKELGVKKEGGATDLYQLAANRKAEYSCALQSPELKDTYQFLVHRGEKYYDILTGFTGAKRDHSHWDFTQRHFNGLKLTGEDLSLIKIDGSSFEKAHLIHCTLPQSMEKVNLKGATLIDCSYSPMVSFTGVKIDSDTLLDWKKVASPILCSNFADFYADDPKTHSAQLRTLVDTIASKKPEALTPSLLLDIFKKINAGKNNSLSDNELLKLKKERAMNAVNLIVSKCENLKDLLAFHELVSEKNKNKESPFAFIRKEQHACLHGAYGNTRTWKTIMLSIKKQLRLAAFDDKQLSSLTQAEIEKLNQMMASETTHFPNRLFQGVRAHFYPEFQFRSNYTNSDPFLGSKLNYKNS
ncbi:MAG: hypothetical protein A3F41_04190 [Coxiella sp. RIFCSPHIGHO2_12_FULL_44_14]|nr:MAG: hypothetical protein A3F41_04190 [Coxiella sp. RIFCSPHIGHO2_12_FULL_44_14]